MLVTMTFFHLFACIAVSDTERAMLGKLALLFLCAILNIEQGDIMV